MRTKMANEWFLHKTLKDEQELVTYKKNVSNTTSLRALREMKRAMLAPVYPPTQSTIY